MMSLFSALVIAATASFGVDAAPDAPTVEPVEMVQQADIGEVQMSLPAADRCFNCSKDSDGACTLGSGKSRMQCDGSRSDCRSRGCKISGSSSCSSAGNVGRC